MAAPVDSRVSDSRRERFLDLLAPDVARCYEEALGEGIEQPVVLVIDQEDPLGRQFAEHYQLRDPVSVFAVAATDALEWLGHERAPLEVLEALSRPTTWLVVLLVVWGRVSVHCVAV